MVDMVMALCTLKKGYGMTMIYIYIYIHKTIMLG